MTIVSSKLLSCSNQVHSIAIPYENGALAWGNKYGAILAIIYVEISSNVEDKVLTMLAILNIVLLLFD